jgi:hypothetical protein
MEGFCLLELIKAEAERKWGDTVNREPIRAEAHTMNGCDVD